MTTIRFDASKRTFIIKPNVQTITRVVKMPMRRFLKRAGVWTAPATRLNCEYLVQNLKDSNWDDEALQAALRGAVPKNLDRSFPSAYKGAGPEPMAHQVEARELAYQHDGYFLAMEQGTAKTKVAIDVAVAHFLERTINALLVISPLTVTRTWAEEFALHAPVAFTTIYADSTFNGTIPRDGSLPVIICGVESLSQGGTFNALNSWAQYQSNLMVVVDESHYIKTPGTIRTKRCIELGTHAKIKLCLTGTSITRNLVDLYSQYEFLDPNIIGVGDFYAFRNRYAIMGGYKRKQIIAYDNVEELMSFIRPVTYTKLKSECMDLPEKVYERRYIKLEKNHMVMYRQLRSKQGLAGLDLKNVLVKMLRSRQLVGGFLPDGDNAPKAQVFAALNMKLQVLRQELDVAEGQAIIYCQWRPEMDLIAHEFDYRKESYAQFNGDQDADERQEIIRQFQAGDIKYLVASISAAATGITLTNARTVIYFSHTDQYAQRSQSEDRVHRKGLKHSVTYIDLIAERTVDETLMAAHSEKKDLAGYLTDQMRQGKKLEDVVL